MDKEERQKARIQMRFLEELLKRAGTTSRGRTLTECVRLLGGDAATPDRARDWLRSEWRRMSSSTQEIERLKQLRMSATTKATWRHR